MKLFGIDFTSAPRKAKPITCASGQLELTSNKLARLEIHRLETLFDFPSFEALLAEEGPYAMAIDFPFGQPRRLVEALGWPNSWSDYVGLVAEISKQEFCELIVKYRNQQPAGDKHHLRTTDEIAGGCSPMMLVGVPVGKMFYEGAPRLLRSGASLLPCHARQSNRTIIEGYPKLVASHLLKQLNQDHQKKSYKNDQKANEQQRALRKSLLEHCQTKDALIDYGISLMIDSPLRDEMIEDSTGDKLDALFCLIQAAAWQLNPKIIPTHADPLEGWIVDPTLRATL